MCFDIRRTLNYLCPKLDFEVKICYNNNKIVKVNKSMKIRNGGSDIVDPRHSSI